MSARVLKVLGVLLVCKFKGDTFVRHRQTNDLSEVVRGLRAFFFVRRVEARRKKSVFRGDRPPRRGRSSQPSPARPALSPAGRLGPQSGVQRGLRVTCFGISEPRVWGGPSAEGGVGVWGGAQAVGDRAWENPAPRGLVPVRHGSPAAARRCRDGQGRPERERRGPGAGECGVSRRGLEPAEAG